MKTTKAIAITLLAAHGATACTSIRPVLVPAEFIPKEQPELIWVVDSNDEQVPVTGPSLLADTIVGNVGSTSERYAMPLTQARMVLAKQPDRKRTTYFLLGTGAFLGLTTLAFAASGTGPFRACRQPPDKEKRCPN